MKHFDQVVSLLRQQIGNHNEVSDIISSAREVSQKWVPPLGSGDRETNGLVYGLVQSGKTGVLTACAALAADEGYKSTIIFTSDNDALYDQTLDRAREAFPGLEILSKADLRDSASYLSRIRSMNSVTVVTKNGNILDKLIQNLSKGNIKGLTALLIDDEADQASPNTKESREDGTRSKIYSQISQLRSFFERNTYLQVTATPQALFLQSRSHELRPKFTVLSRPGSDYVGGDDFFAENSTLIRIFDPNELGMLSAGTQPNPNLRLPKKLVYSLDTFMLAATYKRLHDASSKCAYLCHVSTRKNDHEHLVDLLRQYKRELSDGIKNADAGIRDRLRSAYEDLSKSDPGFSGSSFQSLVDGIGFYSPGIAIKLVNGDTDEDVALKSPYNLFVGGNKLGRGVTIKNLLVSYYGRSPKSPQADTVLQHARMFGYRRKDIGLLRLFLPQQLLDTFRAIHKMEKGLRTLIAERPGEEFRGVFLENAIKPTRRNVLSPTALGIYSASSNYNPAQVLRTPNVQSDMNKIDSLLSKYLNKSVTQVPIDLFVEIIRLTHHDEAFSEQIWNLNAIEQSLIQYKELKHKTHGSLFVDRDRGLEASRRETQGVLDGGEVARVPRDELSLFLLRTKPDPKGLFAWWPQIRFPDGNYAFAFAV